MTIIARFKCSHPSERAERNNENKIRDAIFLHLARIAIAALLAMLGFLLSLYLHSIDKAIDALSASVGKLSDGQQQLSVMAARIDESVQSIDERLERLENKTP